MVASPPMNIIVKVTRKCNFRCEYCHDVVYDHTPISFHVLAHTIARVLAQKKNNVFRFIWHGGEPLLMGQNFYLKALALQQEFRVDGQEIRNTLQTNGYLLDEGFAQFLHKYRFTVGLSLDGPRELHDSQRRFHNGESTFGKVMEALFKLQDNDIPFGVLTVLTSRSVAFPPGDLLEFYRKHGISNVGFLPVRSDCHLNGETLPVNVFTDYMKALFDEWLRMNDPNLQIREFKDWIFLAMGLPGTQCSSSGTCIGSTFSIEPDGMVYNCDKFVGDTRFQFGKIDEINLDNLIKSDYLSRLRSWDQDLPTTCIECQWRNNCAGGCSHDRYLRIASGRNIESCRFKELLLHIQDRIRDHPCVQQIMSKTTSCSDYFL